MTRNEIIEEIYKDAQYIGYCKKVCSNPDIANDLFQYVVMYLMEMNEDKLKGLHQSGGLRMYVARIMYINAKSERSEFMKQYTDRVVYEDMYEPEPIDESIISDVEAELRKEEIFCDSKNIYPASAKLLEIYAECGSYQEVSNRTKIPYKTVRRHIITLREKIIKNINDKNLISNAG